MEVFLEHGYEGTSMDAIARAAGVSKPVVYACFAGKEELFKALFQREEARVTEEIRASLPTAAPRGPEAALAEGFVAYLRAVVASPGAYRTILHGEGGMSAAVARRIRAGRERQAAEAMVASRAAGSTPLGAARRARGAAVRRAAGRHRRGRRADAAERSRQLDAGDAGARAGARGRRGAARSLAGSGVFHGGPTGGRRR